MLDLAVEILDALEVNLATRILLLCDPGSQLFVEAFDLIQLGVASVLAGALLVADFIGLSDKFLAALLEGGLGVLVLVSRDELDLLLNSILYLTINIYAPLPVIHFGCATYVSSKRVLVFLLGLSQLLLEELSIGLLRLLVLGRRGGSG